MFHRIFIIIVLVTMAGVWAAAQTPLQYNNKLVNITDSLHAKGSRWVSTFKMVKVIKEFKILEPCRSDLQQYINAKIADRKSVV